MPEKYFEDQFDDEEVIYVFRKHPIVTRKGLVIAMLGILLPVLVVGIMTYVRPAAVSMTLFFGSIAAGLLLGVLLYFPSWIAWYYSVFIVTDQRFIQITQKGLFHRSVVDIGLNQIQMVNYEISGLQETLLGYGTIMMQTYLGDLVIHDVHHPAKIQKKLFGILREQGVITSQAPAKQNQVDETT
jgi:hypothetical protein